MTAVRVRLLGRFEVGIDDRVVDESVFQRRHAALLVKLLALSGGRSMHREQVMDALWPESLIDKAAPQLHKAASYARSALGDKQAIVMRGDSVHLWPDHEVEVDVARFEEAADLAYSGSGAEAAAAAGLYGGELLPGDPYEEWVVDARERLRLRHVEVLRAARNWEAVLVELPADEEAHLALMRGFVAEGQRLSTLRQFERLERALLDELGVAPSEEAVALRKQVIDEQADQATLIDRTNERELMQRALDEADGGSGSFVLLTGVPGIGKTALGEWLVDRARQRGWIGGQAVAASVDGPWPYAPVLEAVDGLIREAPELLDDLPVSHRDELLRVRQAPASTHEGFGDDDGHQRLFVAIDELVRLASDSRGLVLFIDDLHVADDASLALLHYIARQATRKRLLLIGTARSGADAEALATLRGLVGRHGAREVPIGPLGDDHAQQLIEAVAGDSPAPDVMERILSLSGGTPFYLEEVTRSLDGSGPGDLPEHLSAVVSASFASISDGLRDALTRAAVSGLKFDTDQFVALSGLDDERAFDLLDEGLSTGVLEHTAGGYRFRHGLVRESLLERLAPHRRRRVHQDAAKRFEEMGAPPSRIAHHLIEAELQTEASPWVLLAAKAAQAVGALSDARSLIEVVLESSEGEIRSNLLALRADVFAGMGDPSAVQAYRMALGETEGPMRRLLRAKMARAALMGGDVEAASAALEGLEPDGGPFDGPVLHAKGMLAYFSGDLEAAERAAIDARQHALSDGAPTALLDVLTLQGMVAHNKGEWFDRMRVELTSTADSSELAATVFDCHL